MATAEALLTWARTQLGVVEKPPASNRIKYWDDIGMSGNQGQPWCAAFVLAGLERIGVGPVSRSVYVPTIRNDYQRAKRLRTIADAVPGDQVFFSFGNHTDKTHTGIVESIDPQARIVTSIDGNTTPPLGRGAEWNGGGVYRRTRPWSLTWGVGHPQFDPAHPAPPAVVNFPGDHMHRIDLNIPNLDGNGNGWVAVPNTQADKVISVVAQGAYPPVDGYWNLPTFGRQQRGSDTIIQISEADPKAPAVLSVWVAD